MRLQLAVCEVPRRCDARSASGVQGSTRADLRVEAPSAGALLAGVDQGVACMEHRHVPGTPAASAGVPFRPLPSRSAGRAGLDRTV
jgi:hypothetical protein